MTIPEHLDRVREAHERAGRLRAEADEAALDVRRAIADALDDGANVPEVAQELDLSVVRIYQLARQGRELRREEE